MIERAHPGYAGAVQLADLVSRPRFGFDRVAGGLVPVGFWIGLRDRVYARSRRADPRPHSDGTTTHITR